MNERKGKERCSSDSEELESERDGTDPLILVRRNSEELESDGTDPLILVRGKTPLNRLDFRQATPPRGVTYEEDAFRISQKIVGTGQDCLIRSHPNRFNFVQSGM